MDETTRNQILSIIEDVDDMTIATVREDRYPQATRLSYVNDVFTIYFGTAADSQKARNVSGSNKVYCFVDCDPYGFANIYRTLKVGSGNAAHINRFLCVPDALFLGVTPQDILDFGLDDATHPLTKTDIKRAQDALDNDPFFAAHPKWREAIRQLLDIGVRAEQQALAKWGLNYVIDEYLPRKLADETGFLP